MSKTSVNDSVALLCLLTFNVFSSRAFKLRSFDQSTEAKAGKVRWRFAAPPTSVRRNICPSPSLPLHSLLGRRGESPPIAARGLHRTSYRAQQKKEAPRFGEFCY